MSKTTVPMASAAHFQKPCLSRQEIEELLISKGLQPTLQRVGIARYVLCEANHPSAEDIHLWSGQNLGKISLATVYNTLNILIDADLLRMFRFSHSDKVVYDCNTADHFHFIDESSGKVFDLAQDEVSIDMNIPKRFQVKGVELVLSGHLQNVGMQEHGKLKKKSNSSKS